MGQIKEFAIDLARMVYMRRMSDRDIVETLMTRGFTDREWLRNQIRIVRDNPGIYKTMMGAK